MRLQRWLPKVLGCSLLLAGSISAQAQPPGGMPDAGYGAMPMPGYGSAAPPPPMYQAWPQISAYDNSYAQQSWDNGVWSQSSNSLGRRYRFNVDYITGKARISDSLIGNPNAQRYIDVIRPQLATQQGGGGGGNQQQNPILSTYGGTVPVVPGVPRQPHYELYGALNMGALDRKYDTDGTLVSWGFDNADDSGFRLGFSYLNDTSFRYDARAELPRASERGTEPALFNQVLLIPEDPADPSTLLPRDLSQLGTYIAPADINRALQNNVFNLHGLPLDDGTLRVLSDGTRIGGVTVPYDLDFRVDLKMELYGGQAEWYLTPIVNWSHLKVRPTVGMKYYYLKEGFHFFGRDSGLAYTGSTQQGGGGGNQTLSPDMKIHSAPDGIDNNRDGIIDNAGVFESTGQQQGGGGGGGQQQGTATFLQFHDQFRYPITSYLDNESDSHMGGGLVGLSYDIGGESLMITGSSKFGLLANYEQIRMSGDNIAMHTRESNLLFPTADDATPNSFTDNQSVTHVSPVFEQSLVAEMALFKYVPVIRRIGAFEKAQFRFGYSFLYIGEVVDPAGSVVWRGNPAAGLFPTINYKRDSFTAHSYNFGVSWQF